MGDRLNTARRLEVDVIVVPLDVVDDLAHWLASEGYAMTLIEDDDGYFKLVHNATEVY